MLDIDVIRLVSVKFRTAGRLYDFHAGDFNLSPGDRVVLETDRGRTLGTVVHPPREIPRTEAPDNLKSVIRPATEEDLTLALNFTAREKEAYRFCRQRIQDRRMEMKLVRAEYLFDGSKIIFYFTADGRVDFRELVKDLAHYFHTRIEMRQIGVRDEAKLVGGTGICGRELCCCTFLTEFAPVSVKMAKEQGLALNPNKISGQCGRLLCCLAYEFETYCSLKKGLPKCGRKVHVNGVEGEVVDQSVLAQKVKVKMENGQTREVTPEQVETSRPAESAPDTPTPPSNPEEREKAERNGPAPARSGSSRGPKSAPPRQGKSEGEGGSQESSPQPAQPSAGKSGKRRNRNRRRSR
jgi:cell fate regulator YaaT (PSP1 superfamily)